MTLSNLRYTAKSREVLSTVHPLLQQLFTRVLQSGYDHTPVRGVRTLDKQLGYLHSGWSRTPNSRHLPGGGLRRKSDGDTTLPTGLWLAAVDDDNVELIDPDGVSHAVDVRPYPFREDREHFIAFASFVRGAAAILEIPIRWGGDWDRDYELGDQTFFDLVHFELPRGEQLSAYQP